MPVQKFHRQTEAIAESPGGRRPMHSVGVAVFPIDAGVAAATAEAVEARRGVVVVAGRESEDGQLSDDQLLLRSFENAGEAFYYFGFHGGDDIEKRIRRLRVNAPVARSSPIVSPKRAKFVNPNVSPMPPPPSPTRPISVPPPMPPLVWNALTTSPFFAAAAAAAPMLVPVPVVAVAAPVPMPMPVVVSPTPIPVVAVAAPVPMPPPPPPPRIEPVAGPTCRPSLRLPEKHKPLLFWDTETSGLSRSDAVCQLAYALVVDNVVVRRFDAILKLPPGVTIGWRAQQVHGISTMRCAREGVGAREVLETFAILAHEVLSDGGRLVAHNSAFDVRLLQQTREAWGVVDSGKNRRIDQCFCTMRVSKPYSTLTTINGRQKAFGLAEMYEHLFGHPPAWAKLHCARADVEVLMFGFFGGVHLGWF